MTIAAKKQSTRRAVETKPDTIPPESGARERRRAEPPDEIGMLATLLGEMKGGDVSRFDAGLECLGRLRRAQVARLPAKSASAEEAKEKLAEISVELDFLSGNLSEAFDGEVGSYPVNCARAELLRTRGLLAELRDMVGHMVGRSEVSP